MNKIEWDEGWAGAAQVLEKAADLLESGVLEWIQGEMHHADSAGQIVSVCAWGALRYVDGICVDHLEEGQVLFLSKAYSLAYTALDQSLPISLPTWNDTEGRTKEEVIEAMKNMAKDLHNKAGAS
jgi:hypothetical protein